MRHIGIILAIAAACVLSACAKRDIPWPELEARYANAQSKYADLPGGLRVHYRDQGNRAGEPVVLVHGFAASLHAWEPWAARLGAQYRVITLDLPGHGLTRAPAGYIASTDGNVAIVDEITRRLGAERFVLGGNSMGGGVAWNYALQHPERLKGLILVDAAGWPSPRKKGDGPPAIFKLLGNPAGRAMLKSLDPTPLARRGLASAYVDPKLVTPELVARYTDLARAPGHRDILLTMQNRSRTPTTPATFAAIRTPTLVMVGEADKVIPAAQSRSLAGAIPGAKLIAYPDVGHVPMEQIPDRSAEDVLAFLRALPSN
jgi:pimeloyl-ACP methyl ester carboxylesterase